MNLRGGELKFVLLLLVWRDKTGISRYVVALRAPEIIPERLHKLIPQMVILAEYWLATNMDNDLLAFLAGVGFLIVYLIFSAMTEMGTKLPWKK